MPQTNAFGQTISWEWTHKLGNAQNFSNGKPNAQVLSLDALKVGVSHVRLHSKNVNFGAAVTFERKKDITAVGFANTIYSQVRRWYYASAANPAAGIRLTETIQPAPMWDDGEPDAPWYARIEEDDIEATTDTYFNDAPNLPPYPGDNGVENPNFPYGRLHLKSTRGPFASQHLFYITGREDYEAILVVQQDDDYEVLDSIPWSVIWNAEVVRGNCIPAGGSGTFINIGNAQQRLVLNGAGSSNSKHDAADVWYANAVSQTIQQAAKALKKRQLWMIDAGV
ncbi:MAG TPA: hypothetical protein VEU30_00475 [Thermoanaerobaculia bacterium]|nr:hypothetical protein [Thermoanaerobaculia bacterium]